MPDNREAMNSPTTPDVIRLLRWDIFCQVIDNYGDLGVCWRLCADLAGRGHQVRLWVDDPSALTWMAPGAMEGEVANVQVQPWKAANTPADLAGLDIAHVWVEAFGCNIPEAFVGYWANEVAPPTAGLEPPCWINLEYLSAESYVERSHGLPSPVMHGPASGWIKHFYYPGFEAVTGGLIREPWLDQQQLEFDRDAWLAGMGIHAPGETLISLFCYEPPALRDWLLDLSRGPHKTRMLVTAGRAAAWVISCLESWTDPTSSIFDVATLSERQPNTPALPRHITFGSLTLNFLPHLTQLDFDRLLWSCDLNLVRGEDSLVRAIWARAPFLWQIYEQSDLAHVNKLMAFLRVTQTDDDLISRHLWWNNIDERLGRPIEPKQAVDIVTEASSEHWKTWATTLGHRLCQQEDLVSALLRFVASRHTQKQ